MLCTSMTFRSSPNVSVFDPPSINVTVELAAIRSVRVLFSFSVNGVVLVASSLAGSVYVSASAPPMANTE